MGKQERWISPEPGTLTLECSTRLKIVYAAGMRNNNPYQQTGEFWVHERMVGIDENSPVAFPNLESAKTFVLVRYREMVEMGLEDPPTYGGGM